MKAIGKNPVYRASKRLAETERKWLTFPGIIYLGLIIAGVSLFLRLLNVCSCTVFTLCSVLAILLSVLLIGGTSFSAITGERERKTLDSLRLTNLTPQEVISGKLYPEILALSRLLLALAPTLLITGITSEYGIAGALEVLLIVALSGSFSLLGGMILSSLCRSTSSAIIIGWTLKLVWLLGAPLLDMVIAAITISRTPPPLFSSISPLIALISIVIPQAMNGAWSCLPWSFFLAMPVLLICFWLGACHIYSIGGFSYAYIQRKAHQVYSNGWGPSRIITTLFPGMSSWFSNPAFLREISMQLRQGAGRLPGYLVFIALFLAPYLYARSWGISEFSHVYQERTSVRSEVIESADTYSRGGAKGSETAVIRTPRGDFFILRGHSLKGCLRMVMYNAAGIPLPEDRLIEANSGVALQSWYRDCSSASERKAILVKERDKENITSPISSSQMRNLDSAAMRWGLIGAIWLLLFYLSIRGCCFTIAAVTGENERRTWEDLALSGISPGKVLAGKLMGALILPIFQMTAVFPMLFFFVLSGNLEVIDIISLYLYSVLLIITSGILGLWASSSSSSTHEAQGKALGLIFLFFIVTPFFLPFMRIVALFTMPCILISICALDRRARPILLALGGAALSTTISATCLSPLVAPLTFLPAISKGYLTSPYAGCLYGTTGIPLLNLAASLLMLLVISYAMWKRSSHMIAEPEAPDVMRADLSRTGLKPQVSGIT